MIFFFFFKFCIVAHHLSNIKTNFDLNGGDRDTQERRFLGVSTSTYYTHDRCDKCDKMQNYVTLKLRKNSFKDVYDVKDVTELKVTR